MAAHFEHSQIINRPVTDVFNFFARDHVRNHPRWDPDIHLELITAEPIQVGTIIRRRNSRFGTPVEGSMEVLEFEPDRSFAMKIMDGPKEMYGRTTFTALDDQHTRLTTHVDIPEMEDTQEGRSFLMSRLERSAEIRKRLMETEIQAYKTPIVK
jgi:hypothetical protein